MSCRYNTLHKQYNTYNAHTDAMANTTADANSNANARATQLGKKHSTNNIHTQYTYIETIQYKHANTMKHKQYTNTIHTNTHDATKIRTQYNYTNTIH